VNGAAARIVETAPITAAEESFDGFMARNSRRAPLLAGVGILFFLLRSLGLRAGAVILFVASAALVPMSLLRPEVGTYALVMNFVNEWDTYYKLQSYLPVSVPILFDVAITVGIFLHAGGRERLPRMSYAQNAFLLFYVVWVTFSVIASNVHYPGLWANFRSGFLIRPILYLFLVTLMRTPRQLHRLLLALMLAQSVLMATAMSDYVQKGMTMYRVRGSLSAINYLSYICIVTLPLLVAIFVYLRHRTSKLLVLGLALVTLFVSLQTLSRSGYYALTVTLFFLAYRLSRNPRTLIVSLAFAGLFYLLVPAGLTQRLAEVQSLQRSDRYALSRVASRIAFANPVLGVGWQAYKANFLRYDYEHYFYKAKEPHSLYLAIAASSGFPALGAYLAMYGLTALQLIWLERVYRAGRRFHDLGYHLAIGLQGALVGHFVFGLAGSYGDSYYAYLVLALSVIVVRYRPTHPRGLLQ
jgi:hypothetical protein